MHKLLLSSLLLTALLAGCSPKTTLTPPVEHGTVDSVQAVSIAYSELLQMESLNESRTLCRILDPWRTNRVMMQYLLVPKSDTAWNDSTELTYAEAYGESIVLRTPLERMTVTSSCHAWLMEQLGAEEDIAAMCDTAYVTAQSVKCWMRERNIADAGNSAAPNLEVLLAAQSDAVLISPFENCNYGRLNHADIPMVYCAEYMETSPLGRAEWMKFYGRLVEQGQKADKLFATVESRYNKAIRPIGNKTLLAELPYGATWYVPGGNSTSAQLYADAGYRYLWSEDNHPGSLSLSKEAVLAKGQDCDVWVFKYNDPNHDWTLDDLKRQQPLYGQFKAVKEGNVWGCNTATSDFFDVTPFRPDTLLENFNHFFRPL